MRRINGTAAGGPSTNANLRGAVLPAVVAVLWLLCSVALAADPVPQVTGTCIAAHDGDTITCRVGTEQWKVRLSDIDAPELKDLFGRWPDQPHGTESRDTLAALVKGKDVRLQPVVTDIYGRRVCRVFVGDLDVCRDMIVRGNAWWYDKESHGKENRAALRAAQEAAQGHKMGLWALPNPVAPWDWRKGKR